jgi:hypothetical protein
MIDIDVEEAFALAELILEGAEKVAHAERMAPGMGAKARTSFTIDDVKYEVAIWKAVEE